MARQSGKNELAAQLEAYLLHVFAGRGGQIVKAAPSYHPQIVNSVIRLREVLSTPFSRDRWASRHGHAIEVGRARIMFFSADPAANVVGATASILLAIDEAQDVDQDVYFRGFRPMASTTNATTVLYGTAWDDDNLLERQRRLNRELEANTGARLNFEAPWTVLGALSPDYARFVQGEINRLGADHPIIRTQFLLEPVSAAGRLFSPELLASLRGSFSRQVLPVTGSVYAAGIDVAGQVANFGLEASSRILNRADDTVITLAEVSFDGGLLPSIRVVEHYRWRGMTHSEQYDRIQRLLTEVWPVTKVSVDATGVGAGLASFLARALGDRVDPFVFTSPSKSELGFHLLAAIETGRVSVYEADNSENLRQFWEQLGDTTYGLRSTETLEFAAPGGKHDDFVMSLALVVRAADSMSPPSFGGLIRAQPSPDDLSPW